MSRKGASAPPKPALGVVTPKEVEDAFKKIGIDIKNSFGIKVRKPKIGKQNQATPDTGSSHSFSPQEPDENSSSDQGFKDWQNQAKPDTTYSYSFPPKESNKRSPGDNALKGWPNQAKPDTTYSYSFTSQDQNKSGCSDDWVPSAEPPESSRTDLPPDEVWEDYAHLLYDDNPEVKTADEREGLGFLTGYEENHISVEDLLVDLVWCDKELDSYRSGAGLVKACTPPSLSIDGHTDTDALSWQKEHNKESVILHNDVEAAPNDSVVKANEVVSGIESDGNESDWEQLHEAPPPLVMTEEERLEVQDDGGFEFVHHVPGPEDIAYDDDTISELGASVAPEDGTVVLGDSAEVIALRAEVESVRAENALLRRNYS